MSTFIVAAPTPEEDEQPIKSSAFWPEIDPAQVRIGQRIDGTVTADRLRHLLIEAISSTNSELVSLRTQKQGEGYATLAEIPADDEIDGENILVYRYRRAVGCHAKALTLERMRDFDSTDQRDSNRHSDTRLDQIDDCWRDYRHAISDLLGIARVTVDLL